jgi:methionine-rich copper-binding protein CopC
MVSRLRGGRGLGAVVLVVVLALSSASDAFAHARYDRSEPPAGGMVDGQPFVLKAYFTQELTSKSTIRVVDAYGTQIDLGDGRVDLNDPERKIMYVSLPELPVGVYTVEFSAESAEDGHTEPGTFAFGVGMEPPSASESLQQPAAGTGPDSPDCSANMALDAY